MNAPAHKLYEPLYVDGYYSVGIPPAGDIRVSIPRRGQTITWRMLAEPDQGLNGEVILKSWALRCTIRWYIPAVDDDHLLMVVESQGRCFHRFGTAMVVYRTVDCGNCRRRLRSGLRMFTANAFKGRARYNRRRAVGTSTLRYCQTAIGSAAAAAQLDRAF